MFFLSIFLSSAVTVFLISYFFPGMAIFRLEGVMAFCVLIGLANALIRPFLRLVSLPVTLWKFFVLELFVNALALYFGDAVVYGVEIYTVFAFVFALLALTAVCVLIQLIGQKVRRNHVEKVPKGKKARRREVFILAETLAGIIVALVVSQLITPSATISGKIIYNGVLPQNSEAYTITVVQKQYRSSGDYQTIQTDIPLNNENEWSWDDAKEGVTYQIRAAVQTGGQVATASNTVEVTAPATEQLLLFNITQQELAEVAETPAGDGSAPSGSSGTEGGVPIVPPDTPQQATISGTLDLNGYIPNGSQVLIYRKASDQQNFILARQVPAEDGGFIAWDSAVAGQAYTYYGVLQTPGGTEIGRSQSGTVIAPSINNSMTINSTAVPPQPPVKVSISGKIKINGAVPMNSSVHLLQKKTGASDYQEFAEVDATDDVTWSYSDADEATQYNVTAVLRVNNMDYRDGNILTVTAPATGEVITIDTGIPPPPADCAINYYIRTDWGVGMTVDILIKNNTSSTLNNWQLAWIFPGNQRIEGMWNATPNQTGQNVTATGDLPISANGGTRQIGFNASYSGQNQAPDRFTLNGNECDLY